MGCCGAGISTSVSGGTPGPPGPPGPPGSPNLIVWRSDGTGTATTFADVMAVIDVTIGPCEILCDRLGDSLTIPNPTVDPDNPTTYDLKGASLTFPYYSFGLLNPTVSCDDGVILRNLSKVYGSGALYFGNSGTGVYGLSWNVNPHCVFGGGLLLESDGNYIIDIADSSFPPVEFMCVDGMIFYGKIFGTSGGGSMKLRTYGKVDWGTTDVFAAIGLDLVHDGGCFPLAAFAGPTISNIPMTSDGGFGATALRPLTIRAGLLFFDTTTVQQLVYNGTIWVAL